MSKEKICKKCKNLIKGLWVSGMGEETFHKDCYNVMVKDQQKSCCDDSNCTCFVLEKKKTEHDPYFKGQHEAGAKLDAGKPRMGLVLGEFGNALQAVAEVGTYGAKKYSDNGWLDVPKAQERYTDAGLRHEFAYLSGELKDSDTDLLHLAHRAWNSLAVLELKLREIKRNHNKSIEKNIIIQCIYCDGTGNCEYELNGLCTHCEGTGEGK